MCGIAGTVNLNEVDLEKMMRALQHRGPDAQTLYQHEQVALIHTRLAIQDIHLGMQPFHYGDYSIVFNGEIYNHQALRQHLTEFTFQTNSDTETLLYLFIKYQHKMYELLDGMFAFCIYDKAKNTLTLARDRAGKKPLYYYHAQNSFIFSSELNAIKAVKNLTIQTDAINCYLRTGLIWSPHTTYQNVLKLEAASYLTLNISNLSYQTHTYFNMLAHYENQANKKMPFSECINAVETKLQTSIADRLTASDVEVGVFLSGGIDSNLIAALASGIKSNLRTFTVKFDGLYDESPLALLTAKQYNTNHQELSISSNLHNDIEKILLGYGEPFMDSSAIPSYYVSREASKQVKVVLGGDGADELFAGYRRYVPAAYDFIKYFKLATPLLALFPKAQTKQSLYNYLYRLTAMANKKGLDFYLSATTDVFEDVFLIKDSPITAQLGTFIESVFANNSLSLLNKMLYMDYRVILFNDLLVKMDIASMANSLEVRSPFLSKHLLEFSPGMPDHCKINKFKTKYLLRKLAEKYLPPALVNQPKRGFEVPLKKWVDHDLHQAINDTLRPGNFAENFIDPHFIQQLLAKKVNIAAEKRAKILWSLYCLEVWHKHETKNSLNR